MPPVPADLAQLLLEQYKFWLSFAFNGEAVWLLAYFFFIRLGFKQKTCAMPLLAICLAIPLNFLFAFVGYKTEPTLWPHSTDGTMGDIIVVWTWRVCFVASVILLWQYLRWGRHKPSDLPQMGSYTIPVIIGLLLLAGVGQYTFVIFNEDYNCNQMYGPICILMGLSFIFMYFARPEIGHSLAGAWSRMISDSALFIGDSIIQYQATVKGGPGGVDPINVFPGHELQPQIYVHYMTVAVVILDLFYVWLVWQQRRKMRLAAASANA